MLAKHTGLRSRLGMPRRQAGVVLMVALIMLVAMTLAGLALIRSMDTSNLIAGNMAFQQSATHSADTGVETAIAWLEANKVGGALELLVSPVGFYAGNAAGYDPFNAASWSSAKVCQLPMNGGVCSAAATANTSGNTVSFIIQRLCNANGVQTAAQCATQPGSSSTYGNNEGAGEDQLKFSTAVYFRITVRVAGPRNTVSYVQSIVSM